MSTASSVAGRAAPGSSRVRWKIFVLMLLLVSINYVDRASLSVAMPAIASEFDLDPATQGLLLSSFFWTYVLMQLPGGLLVDRYRPRIVVAASTVGLGLFQTVAGVSPGWLTLLLARCGLGAAGAPIYPAGGKLNAIWMSQHERARGAALLDGGAPLGAAVSGLVIAGLMSATGSWRLAFVVTGLATIACGCLAWWYIRNIPGEHSGVGAGEARHIARAHALEDAAMPPLTGAALSSFFRHRSVWCMCLGWVSFNTVFYGLLTWMPTYLFQVHGFEIRTLGGATFAIFFIGFVGELVGGTLCDHWRASGGKANTVYRTMFAVAALVTTVSILAVAYVTDPLAVVALLSVTLFFLRWCGMYWAIPSLLTTRHRAGFLGACMNLAGNIAGIVVPILIGFIVQATGSYFLALLFFAGAGFTLLIFSSLIDFSRKLPV